MNNKNDDVYFTAAQLAGLPGMPGTTFGCRKWLEREAAAHGRARAGRGGGREYPITCLPAATQAALAGKVLSAASTATAPLTSLGASSTSVDAPSSSDLGVDALGALFDAKPENVKAEARERLAIVREYSTLLARGFEREAVVQAVTSERRISAATLSRYLAIVRGRPEHQWLFLLCPAYTGRTALAEMSAEAWETLKADYLRVERPSASACIGRLRNVANERGWSLPSNRTMLRRLEALPRAVVVMKREGMKAAKALYPPQLRDRAALHALQIVNGDGYKHNLWVRFEDGEVRRAHTWFWQDVYSSKLLAWRTEKTEHTQQIQLSFGDLCERFGIPHAVTIDNTLAAANKTMSGGIKHRFRFKVREDEPDGVFKLLGVDVHWATPGHGQAKPIERLFGQGGVGEVIDKAPEFAGAWTGASPVDKPEYDGKHRVIDLADLEKVIAREVAHLNALAGRRSPLHNGRSFDDVFKESYARVEIRKASEAQRRLWLLSTEPVRANSRDGSITLDAGRVTGERQANRYWHPQMIDHAGAQLVAKFDPRRLHQGVHVYSLDGRWICFAECDRPAGFNDANAGRERNRARNTFLRAQKEIAAAEIRMNTLDAAKTLQLPSAGGVADSSIPAPKVVRPMFGDPLERPAFQPAERTEAERAELEQLEQSLAAPAEVNVLELRSDADKHAHWKALDARRAGGEQLTDRDEDFWKHWQTQDYYAIAVEAEAEFQQGIASRQVA